MRTFATDPVTGDLALVSGRLVVVEGPLAVAERLRGRLTLWQGEWFADLAVGVPFLDFLGQKGALALADATLRAAITTCPGVASLEAFAADVDAATRRGTVTFRARTTDGEVVEERGFRVGGGA